MRFRIIAGTGDMDICFIQDKDMSIFIPAFMVLVIWSPRNLIGEMEAALERAKTYQGTAGVAEDK